MSKIVAFRDRVVETLKEKITELREVDWYDGQFDEHDVADWVLNTPSAWVSITNVPTANHSTGESNATLRIIVAVIDQDINVPRDADTRVWKMLEDIHDLARFNTFGDPNAGHSCDVSFRRLRDPQLRREGIALGICEWKTILTIGRNRMDEREFMRHPVTGEKIPVGSLTVAATPRAGDVTGARVSEFLGFPPDYTYEETP